MTVKNERWAALRAAIPEKYREDIINALDTLYSLYSPADMARFLGSLYDPKTGGWYHSRSAMNYEQFGPDIENTYFALTFMGINGMAEKFDGEWWRAMPREIIEKAAYWIQSLQDEDGYFYHPQWPKSYIMEYKRQSRITRDKGSAGVVLKKAGIPQLYAQKPIADSEEKKPQGPSLLSQYESDENFREYLQGFERELENYTGDARAFRFYYYGNLFQSTVGLLSEGLKKMLVEFFDKYQNPENGMWSDDLYFNSTNGIHKIASVYSNIGAELKYVDKIVDSTLKILQFDVDTHPAACGCEVYNIWSCLPYVYENIRLCSPGTPEEREARCRAIIDKVYAGAAEAILTTYNQIKDSRYPDGSFSYNRNATISTMQGCPCALPDTREGDQPGTIIAAYDIPHHIFGALELREYAPSVFTEEERLIYIDTIYERIAEYNKNVNNN